MQYAVYRERISARAVVAELATIIGAQQSSIKRPEPQGQSFMIACVGGCKCSMRSDTHADKYDIIYLFVSVLRIGIDPLIEKFGDSPFLNITGHV